jgi:DNA excision repair protein ERCC-4
VIEADYRERNSGTAHALLGSGAGLSFVPLKTGDYRVDRALVIERKSAADFTQSLFDGRLFSQVSRLARSAPRALLLVEGALPRLAEPTIRGTLLAVTAVFGVPILFSKDPGDSAQWILGAARQFAARKEDALARPGWRPRGKRARQLYILQGLPGVGPRRAAALLDRFGSVRGVLSAEANALMLVEGIGAKTASKIVWLST